VTVRAGPAWLQSPILGGSAFIVLATLLAYWPALGGGFIWDDDLYVSANPLLSAPDGLRDIWLSTKHQSQYFPLVYTSFRLQYSLWGLDPLGYHVVNVLLHSANALLAWAVLRRLEIPGAWLAAAIFALHPVQVESAAWITELKNTQSTFFYLLSLLAWMKFTDEQTRRPARCYALALGLYLLALLSKTTACTLPAAMLLVLWLRKQPLGLGRIGQVLPFLALGVAMGLVSVFWEGQLGNYAERFGLHFGPLDRFLIGTRAVWFYLGKLIWPVDLAFSYPRWELDPSDPTQYLWAVACLGLAAALWWTRRTLGRGPIAAATFYVATLSPMLGVISLFTFYYTFVADHYQYLACLGPFALFAAGASHLHTRFRRSRIEAWAGSAVLLGLLGALTWQQAGAYHGLESLWRDTLRKNPSSWMAHNNLGHLLDERGERADAEAHYREALRLNPDNGETNYNLANLLFATKRTQEAIGHYQKALRFYPEDADFRNNLGAAFFAAGQVDEAIVHYHEALRRQPGMRNARFNLAVALEAQQRWDEAIAEYRHVLRLEPGFQPARKRLRALRARLKQMQ